MKVEKLEKLVGHFEPNRDFCAPALRTEIYWNLIGNLNPEPLFTNNETPLPADIEPRSLEIERDPNRGVVTGIYLTTHPPVYTAFDEPVSDGW